MWKINSRPNILVGLTIFWLLMIFALGLWWLFLLLQFGQYVSNETMSQLPSLAKLITMAKWEGLTFFVLLILVSSSLFLLYIQNLKKTQSMQAFFASLTHELKSPLASIKLSAEVLDEKIQDKTNDLSILVNRLLQDTNRLEADLDNILQLSRIEQGGGLNCHSMALQDFIEHQWKLTNSKDKELNLQFAGQSDLVLADELALQLILRNLFDNSKSHSPESKEITIKLIEQDQKLLVIYFDHGKPFSGNQKKIGQLFYKYNSPKGSGIGLYLIRRLTEMMGGKFQIQVKPHLEFHLTFLTAVEKDNGI